MAQLLLIDQEKYVPTTTITRGVPEVLTSIIFEERARNVKWTFEDGMNKYDRLEGITRSC